MRSGLVSAEVKINSAWFTYIIFVLLKGSRHQNVLLEVISLLSWLVEGNAPIISPRTQAPAI